MGFLDNLFGGGGGLDTVGVAQPQQQGFLERFNGGLDNPLVQFGLALAGGRTPQAGFENAANALMNRQALMQRRRDAEAARDLQERNFAFRQAEAERAQANADRAFSFQKDQAGLPSGWARTESGLAPIPGGPADPAYLQSAAGARAQPRQFSVGDVTKLSEEGGKYSNLSGFADTFKDAYAGYKLPGAGEAAMYAGRMLPEGVVGKDVADAAQWWQGYDRFKNVVRNDLFGAALTKNEQAAFEKADINPQMDPKAIRSNLETQQNIALSGMKRKANALIQSGYDPKAIAQAYGLDPGELGGKAAPGPRGGGDPLAQARAAIAAGAPRDKVIERLRQNGINPGGL